MQGPSTCTVCQMILSVSRHGMARTLTGTTRTDRALCVFVAVNWWLVPDSVRGQLRLVVLAFQAVLGSPVLDLTYFHQSSKLQQQLILQHVVLLLLCLRLLCQCWILSPTSWPTNTHLQLSIGRLLLPHALHQLSYVRYCALLIFIFLQSIRRREILLGSPPDSGTNCVMY